MQLAGGTLAGGNGGGSANSFADSTQGIHRAAAVTVQGGGTRCPGRQRPGTLSVAGNVTMRDGLELVDRPGRHTTREAGIGPTDVNTNARVATPLDFLFGSEHSRCPVDGGGQSFVPGQTYDFFIGRDDGAVGGLPSNVTFVPTDFASPVSPSDFALTRSADGTNVILTFTPVPEPGTFALVGAAALAGWRLRRSPLVRRSAA